MLRTQSILPRFLAKWVSQVAASVGATLAATAIYAALPKPATPEAPQPELTSGGKYATRAIAPAAEDGLDRMPLPRVSPVVAQVLTQERPDLHQTDWDGVAPLVLVPGHPARAARPVGSAAHVEIRRAVAAQRQAAAAPMPVAARSDVVSRAADPSEDRGSLLQSVPRILPRILPAALSEIHDAWSLTASAGGSLVARVVPQLP